MSAFQSILIVDDEKNTRDGLTSFLESLDYDVLSAENAEEGFRIYENEKPDLVLTDVKMPGKTGVQLLEQIKTLNPQALVILLTAYGTVEDAVKAMKKGAFYYLTKPVNLEELEFLINKAFSRKNLEEENKELKQELYAEKYAHGEILASSKKMQDILATVEKVASSTATVLIEGESGTGKELIAHRIHSQSPRHQKPFVAVHCAALTESLLSSELFGHEKGAFTGASERKIGRFEKAHRGTLFLDEIGEITPETQVKLLRVLQEGEFERVGGTKTIKVDVRVICATNKNLVQEVKEGRFREDLYYRLNVIYLKVPSLRERAADIPTLANYFLKYIAQSNGRNITAISEDAMAHLEKYPWPGNVRELKNIIERMVVLSSGTTIEEKNIPEDIIEDKDMDLKEHPGLTSSNLSEMEKELIRQAITEVKGNKSLAAKKLGISRRTLYRKIEEYGI